MAKGIYIGASGGYKTELVQGDIIPKTWTRVTTGTSYKASDGTKVTASGYVPDGNIGALSADRAFDGDATTPWFSGNDDVSALKWIKLELPSATKITKMKTCVTFSSVHGKNCKIQGSKDDSTWVDLFAITSPQADDTLTEVSLNNTDYYKYYRICGEINRTGLSLCVDEWQVSEYEGTVYDSSTPNKAHKVKKAYIGVSDKARKIKKGYIGVGGKARLFFSSDKELVYYGTATPLSQARMKLAGASVGTGDSVHPCVYAIFAGGSDIYGLTPYSTVDAYSDNLTRSIIAPLGKAVYGLAGGNGVHHAIFAGGDSGGYQDGVYAYDSNLTMTSSSTRLSEARRDLACARNGVYVIFAGGMGVNWQFVNNVDAYNSELTRTTPTTLSISRTKLAGARGFNCAIFAGGTKATLSSDVPSATVDSYNDSLVRSTLTELSVARDDLSGASVGVYALFAGGYNSDVVDAYNSSLVRSTPTALSRGRRQLASASLDSFAVFAGGHDNSVGVYVDTVDVYDTKLTRTTIRSLSVARGNLPGARVGNYALFGGGATGSAVKNEVDVYQEVG